MKVGLYVSRSFTKDITGVLSGEEVGNIAVECGYSASHGVGVLYGHFTANTEKAQMFVQAVLKEAISKANQRGMSLRRYAESQAIYEEFEQPENKEL